MWAQYAAVMIRVVLRNSFLSLQNLDSTTESSPTALSATLYFVCGESMFRGPTVCVVMYLLTTDVRRPQNLLRANITMCSVAVLAEILPRSPRKLFILIIKKYIYRIKVSENKII